MIFSVEIVIIVITQNIMYDLSTLREQKPEPKAKRDNNTERKEENVELKENLWSQKEDLNVWKAEDIRERGKLLNNSALKGSFQQQFPQLELNFILDCSLKLFGINDFRLPLFARMNTIKTIFKVIKVKSIRNCC